MIITNDNYHDVDCYYNLYMYDTENNYNDISNDDGNDVVMIIHDDDYENNNNQIINLLYIYDTDLL